MARTRRNSVMALRPDGRVLVVAVAVSVITGMVFVALLGRDGPPVGPPGANGACDTNDPLYITADPSVTPTLSAVADEFVATLRAAGRPCVRIVTRATPPGDVAASLQRGWDTATAGPPPDVWIPSSSAWLSVFLSESGDSSLLPDDAMVVARSQLVFAMPAPMADVLPSATMRWRDLLELYELELGWGEYGHAEWGQPRLAVADPLTSTNGLLTLLSVDAAQERIWDDEATGDATVDRDIGVLRLRRAVAAVVPDAGALLRRYVESEAPQLEFSGVPLLEHELWQFNRGEMPLPAVPGGGSPTDAPVAMSERPPVPLQAVYPAEGALGADYPYVVLNGDWVDEMAVQVADEFEDFLLGEAGQRRFEADGFRNADNRSNPAHRTGDGLRRRLGGDLRELPGRPVVAGVRTSWRNVAAPSRTLLVVDVSGSMVASAAGGERTRLEATVDAAARSLDVLPESSDVGLWEFSTNLRGGEHGGDYRELVPVGPLNREVDGADRKARIVECLEELEPRNDTALNDTALAAYESLLSSYATYVPETRHTIVLLTDGRNDDEGSISNAALVEQLERLRDQERPVRIVAVAYGDEADIAHLEEVAEVTGGRVLASPDAGALEELFLAALAGA